MLTISIIVHTPANAYLTTMLDNIPYQPQIIFTFTDGYLSNIKLGQMGT
jgi:hypothetical protein